MASQEKRIKLILFCATFQSQRRPMRVLASLFGAAAADLYDSHTSCKETQAFRTAFDTLASEIQVFCESPFTLTTDSEEIQDTALSAFEAKLSSLSMSGETSSLRLPTVPDPTNSTRTPSTPYDLLQSLYTNPTLSLRQTQNAKIEILGMPATIRPDVIYDIAQAPSGWRKAYHGSALDRWLSILLQGLDPSYARRQVYGEGVYLSHHLSVARSFAPQRCIAPASGSWGCVAEIYYDPLSPHIHASHPDVADPADLPESYILVRHPSAARITRLFIYRTAGDATTTVRKIPWLVIIVGLYILMLLAISLWNRIPRHKRWF
eukprot:TRINITY_DN7014_c0_g3_i1.p1 TRINITY_DN7014_c0_g3~~TRINITY_DN7014_c0_g3_i1.p1  ORF type:complete len:320 (-),score=39.43 TRINITY_DN7014_c0_g3_i1:95-1054(-)